MHCASFLTVSVAAIDDLDWLYKAADSELGLMSPCGLMLERARWGMQGVEFTTEDSCPEEARLEALELVRNVRELLLRIAERHAVTLERLHQPRQWPTALTVAFGVAAPLASRTSAARAAYKRETDERVARSEAVAWWLEQLVGRGKRDDKLLVRAIACEARRAREEAYEAYETARALVTFAAGAMAVSSVTVVTNSLRLRGATIDK